MSDSLRTAWTKLIHAEDYESHMAAVGQAQVNAQLVEQYFHAHPLMHGELILFAGAGTGQMFQYASPSFLLPYATTFTDINPNYLKWLSERLRGTAGLHYETLVDDIENTSLQRKFALVIVVLVLEHVDWKKAIATIADLAKQNVFIIIQENPPEHSSAINPARRIPGTMNVFTKAHPHLIPRHELVTEFCNHHFSETYSSEKYVADGKKMLAVGFTKNHNAG